MKYILKSIQTSASILVEYEHGLLRMLEFEDTTMIQVSWFMKHCPAEEANLIAFCKAVKFRMSNTQTDLSFLAFWNAFAHKVDKKKQVEKLWSALTDVEKQAVFACIPSYHRFVKIMNQNSAYPGTWLRNRMWENEYVVK